ncbi:MAG: V-type ATP synthase subunit E [Deltaproteobacteria bacterium]
MAKIKDDVKTDGQEAQEICAKIRQESESQVADILARAKKEAEKILANAKAEAEDKKNQMLKDLEKELARTKDRIMSGLNLEKKKAVMDEKSKFAQLVLAALTKRAEEFRNSKEYPAFLKNAILEGAVIVDNPQLDIFYSESDEPIIDDTFIKETTAFAANKLKKVFVFKFQKGDFKDVGVIVRSQDGRLAYDNRFLSRLKRVQEEVYMKLLKESF